MASTARRFAKNSAVFLSSSVLTKALSFLFIVASARYLGTEGYGRYAFIFAVATVLVVFNTFGLETVVVREIAQAPGRTGTVLTQTLYLRAGLGVAALLMAVAITLGLHKPREVELGLLLVTVGMLLDGLTGSFKSVMTAHERLDLQAMTDVAYRATLVACGLVVIWLDLGFLPLVACVLVASMVALTLSHGLCTRVLGVPCRLGPVTELRGLLRKALPVAAIGVIVSLYLRSDVLMLSVMRGDRDVGWYSASYSVSETLLLISTAVNAAIYPVFSRLAQAPRETLTRTYTIAFKALLAVGLPAAAGLTVVSERLILLLFGHEFMPAAAGLQVLAWSSAVTFCNSLMVFLLYALHHEGIVLKLTSTMLIFNVVANWVVIPSYGFVGASVTTLLTECLGFVMAFTAVSRRFHRLPLGGVIVRPVVAAAVLGAGAWMLRGGAFGIQLAVTTALAAPLVYWAGGFSPGELQRLWDSATVRRG